MKSKKKYTTTKLPACLADVESPEDAAIRILRAQLAASEARAERYRSALVVLACLGNGDRYGNSEGNAIARVALAEGEAS